MNDFNERGNGDTSKDAFQVHQPAWSANSAGSLGGFEVGAALRVLPSSEAVLFRTEVELSCSIISVPFFKSVDSLIHQFLNYYISIVTMSKLVRNLCIKATFPSPVPLLGPQKSVVVSVSLMLYHSCS